jgi:hypothetical protein
MAVERVTGRVGAARDHWVGIVDAAHDKLAAKIDARKVAHVAGILEAFEADLAPHLAPLLAGIVDNPEIPQPIRELVAAITEPQHFTQSLLIGIAVGAVVSPVLVAATAPLTQVLANEAWSRGPTIPLSPDLLAASVIKGVVTEAQAASVAEQSGVSAGHFHTMVQTAGQSFGSAEALLLLRRGQIDQAEFERILHYSNTRNDFIPDILKLRYAPPPAGEVIAGALKAHLSDADATDKLAEAGIDPVNFPWMKATAGRPYGTMEGLQLLNRGLIDEARMRQVIAQSDVNPAYADDILHLRVYLPPARSVIPLLRSGAITEARARVLLQEHGLQPQDIDAYILNAQHTKAGTAKELTGAQVIRMYADRFIDRATAQTRLATAAYPPDQVTLLLDFADRQRAEKLMGALISKVGTLYVAHKLDRSTAATALNGGPVPAAVQADLFHVWDLERTANVHHPTPAQIVGAYRRQIITPLVTRTRLTQLGVSAADLPIVVADGFPPTTKRAELVALVQAVIDGDATFPAAGAVAAKTKDLSRADLVKLFDAKEITETQLHTRLMALGYDSAEADAIITLAKLAAAPGA